MTSTASAPTPELYFDTVLADQRTAALRGAVHLDLFTSRWPAKMPTGRAWAIAIGCFRAMPSD
jgi:hypothetical protein